MDSPVGAAAAVLLSLVSYGGILLWARQRGHAERWPLFLSVGALTILVTVIYTLAVAAGWWGGAYFRAPLIVQLATLLPLSLAVWLGWLMGYGWLAEHSRRPLLIYALLGVLIVLAVAAADRAELGGGLLVVAADGATWIDALLAVCIMLAPVLLFEGIRRSLARDALP